MAHHAGGDAVEPQPPGAPIPCAVQTGDTTETATIGVNSSGTVFYAPRTGSGPLNYVPVVNLNEPSMIARSRDEGATWTAQDPESTPPHGSAVPWMHVDPDTDRIWYATVSQCDGASSAHISWSDDDGETWQTNFSEDDCRQLEGGMSVVEGPAPAGGDQPVGYSHVVYHCGNVSDIFPPRIVHCWKTLDGGETWSFVEGPNMSPPPEDCDDPRPRGRAIGPDGTFYWVINVCDTLELGVSRDEGDSWEVRPVTTTTIRRLDVSSIDVDQAGNIYVAWVGEGDLPFLLVSRDEGATWSDPLMIAAPGVDEVTNVAVTARDTGHVVLSYLGSSDGGVSFNGFITESDDADGEAPIFWSAPVNDPEQPLMLGPVARSFLFGDRTWYITNASGPDGTPWAAFHCAHTAACPFRTGVVGRLSDAPVLDEPHE